jgi:DNA invertase Pin-like site-specific DNA recombinase
VHENRESTARQYDLKRQAQVLGWAADQIVVIDEDLGLSGATANNRNGFQRLVAEVGLGRVGVVMGLEVSRLARSSTDWHRLLEICALADTLILDEDGIYDPSHFNDRLLLGLKGTMSEAELHLLRARLLGGQLNKARRGELWMKPPIGFVHDSSGHVVFDPDQQVQRGVRLLFETFRQTGSALRVVHHFKTEGILWLRRITSGVRAGELLFGPLDHSRVLGILHNPRYTGAFVYGRTRQRKVILGGQLRYRRLKREEWSVFLPNMHPGYISWEEFESNQAKLLANANGYGEDRRKSPAREGAALLQGLVLCGVCGLRMTVRYHTVHGHPIPDYVCQRRGIQTAEPVCQRLPGAQIDHAVTELVLKAVNPASLEVALEVFEELRARQAEVDRLRRAQVQRAREEAELAQRQYLLARPENRLVVDNLERQWNEKLTSLAQAEEEYSRMSKSQPSTVTDEDRDRVHALASDLSGVWNDPRTPARDRKRMLRLLIEDITLVKNQKIQIHLRWKAGATTSIERALPLSAPDLVRTPADIVELVRVLATEQTDAQIARTLNARWLRTGKKQSFTRLIVRHIRNAYGIPSYVQHLRGHGWLTAPEVAVRMGVHSSTAKRFAVEGVLRAVRADDRGLVLFEPAVGPLPQAHPGKLPLSSGLLRAQRPQPPLPPRRSGSTPVDGPVNAHLYEVLDKQPHQVVHPDETDQPPRNRRNQPAIGGDQGSEQLRPDDRPEQLRGREWQFPERSLGSRRKQ